MNSGFKATSSFYSKPIDVYESKFKSVNKLKTQKLA